jgi:5-bromo-4-chloroindolyl phosphate hydrolysis protein
MNEKKVYEIENSEVVPQSSIKLIRNSRGYNYEIKIYSDNLEEAEQKLEKMNKILLSKYGSEPDVQ